MQYNSNYLRWFHVQNFGDSTLHDQKMGIVHIELNRSEKIGHTIRLNIGSIDHVLIFSTDDDLTSNDNFVILVITWRKIKKSLG